MADAEKKCGQMSEDGGLQMKSRLRAGLVAALKHKRMGEAALLRALIGAIDNAEAAPAHAERMSLVRHEFRAGSAETNRLVLSEAQVRDLLLHEINERARAATEFERCGEVERAEALRTEALMVKRYVE